MGKLRKFYEKHQGLIWYGVGVCGALTVGVIGFKLGERYMYEGFVTGIKALCAEAEKKELEES